MANPLYNMITGFQQNMPSNYSTPTNSLSPMNKISAVMQAMNNPAQFVKKAFPDIPEYMQNNPQQILQYLQQTRNIPNETIQKLTNMLSGNF